MIDKTELQDLKKELEWAINRPCRCSKDSREKANDCLETTIKLRGMLAALDWMLGLDSPCRGMAEMLAKLRKENVE